MTALTCFKAYDIRGRLGEELNSAIAFQIGRAFAVGLSANRVVIGRDCRASSAELMQATVEGLLAQGVEVIDLGLCGTEEMYFATTFFAADGGIEVTASHNPMDYNGMKMVRQGSAPLDAQTGFATIQALAEANDFGAPVYGGRVISGATMRPAYVEKVLSFIDLAAIRPMKILVNAGNGAAGPTFDAIEASLAQAGVPLTFVKLNHVPDGSFPNGIPNPLLSENQPMTANAVLACGADLGVAWDGDFDRCFLFDHRGRFIAGEYIVGLLAEAFLVKEPQATIIHDPRVIWNTQDVVRSKDGTAIMARTGHAFVKQMMRDTGAVYGGEMSAHHYFRDFMACDSGMIPWLLVVELLCRRNVSLADLMDQRIQSFPSSGEVNFRVADPVAATDRVLAALGNIAISRDDTDGLSLSFENWRLNLRASNTEPLLRLNVEARLDRALISSAIERISALIMQA